MVIIRSRTAHKKKKSLLNFFKILIIKQKRGVRSWVILTIGIIIGIILSAPYTKETPPSSATSLDKINVCFTPDLDCSKLIIEKLAASKEIIYVQAYSITDNGIINELINAKNRGIEVKLMIDCSRGYRIRSNLRALEEGGIEIYFDKISGIAHNKSIFTGSYNFSNAARKRNAENLLYIKDEAIARMYLENWHKRFYVNNHSIN